MPYVITPIMRGPIRKYELRKGAEYIGEFPTLRECEAMRDASEAAGADDFLRGYIEALYFTEHDTIEGDFPMSAKLSDKARALCVADCVKFQSDNAVILALAYAAGYEPVQAGRDFWFTRNGHGCGFWDRDELQPDDIGELLSDAARQWVQLSAYAGDDCLIGLEG